MPKKFDFRLEQVLKVRAIRRKMAERDLHVLRSQINQTQEQKKQVRESLGESFQQNIGTIHLFPHQNTYYRQDCEARIESLNQTENELKSKERKQTSMVVQKMQAEKVLIKLKEKQKLAHQQEVDQSEQKEMEELDILKRGKT